jgi:virginiamycin B lyase
LIVDSKGIVWYAGNRAAHIGRLDPESGAVQQFATPDGVQDPHTLVFDGKGGIWFTAQQSNAVGHLDPGTGTMRALQVPTPNARPYGIVVAPDGRPWIVLFGTNKLATVDPGSFTLREIPLPRAEARPRRLVITSDGAVWYGDYAGGQLGRYEPATGAFQEWPLPGGAGALPYAMALDDRDRIWLVETGPRPNRFVAFDPRTATFDDPTPIPSGAGSVRHMMFHQATRTIWFGTDMNTIGRARLTD